jgi:hypothetical protein
MNYLHPYILKTFSALCSYSYDENIQFWKIALVHPNETPIPPKVAPLLMVFYEKINDFFIYLKLNIC